MCQSQQFVTWDAGFCHMEDQSTFCRRCHDSLSRGIQASVTPAQTFVGKKIKAQRSSKFFIPLELELGTYTNLYSFESSMK